MKKYNSPDFFLALFDLKDVLEVSNPGGELPEGDHSVIWDDFFD